MKTLVEGKFGHGARPLSIIHRKIDKFLRPKVAKSLSFDWTKGYDIRDITGPIKIKNQGSNDSCSGQAGSYFLEIQRYLQNIRESELSAKSIYSPIAYPGGGTTVTALMTQIGSAGANREAAVLSYDINGNPLPEQSISDKSWETSQLTQDALTRAGYTPYDLGVDIDEVASAIQNYGAIIWEIRGKNNGTWLSTSPQPPVKGNPNPYFYHFMCCIGAKMINGKKTIIALQSMGTSVGDNGIQYFTEDYFNSGHIIDCFTFIYDKNLIPPSNYQNMNWSQIAWAEIAKWFKKQWALGKSLMPTY